MIDNEKVIQMIYDAFEEFSLQFPEDRQFEKSLDTVLYGDAGVLDSIELVNFIVAVEQKIEEEFSVFLSIADEKAMSQTRSPFKTIGTLSEYVSMLLKDNIT